MLAVGAGGGCLDIFSLVCHFSFVFPSLWEGGSRVVRWSWVNFKYRGVLQFWITVVQGPTALAVGAGGGCLDIFFSFVYHLYFSLCLGDGQINTEILSERAVKPKTTNQLSGKGWCDVAG